jgi:DNA mismatch repair protein MutS
MKSDATPLMKQYQEIKGRHPGAILFFRVGDFYEMFYDDAIEAARILQIALTTRDKSKEGAVPLCGIPHHAASSYLAKLVKAGRTVAICEQMEDPKQAKLEHGGPVRREVVKVITPGTLTEPDLLQGKENNFLAAVCGAEGRYGFAYADLSTGEFHIGEVTHESDPKAFELLTHELSRIDPKEILAAAAMAERLGPWNGRQSPPRPVEVRPDHAFAPVPGEQILREHFKVRSLEGYGCRELPKAVGAAGALLRFLQETQRRSLDHITGMSVHAAGDALFLDGQTQRNLELTRRMMDGGIDGTLLSVLDRTLTAMGGRLLRARILKPALSVETIEGRLDAVAEGVEALEFRMRLRSKLESIGDLERIIGRVALGSAHPRDMVSLRDSAEPLPSILKLLTDRKSAVYREVARRWDDLADIRERVAKAIVDDPPLNVKDGGYIREGFDSGVDELRETQRNAGDLLVALESRERERTGIDSLKVRYNQVFGYSIEVTKTHLSKVPPDYHRKQTLTNAERFITEELKTLEDKIVGAGERLKARENELFESLRATLAKEATRVQSAAAAIGELDLLSGLSEAAAVHRYSRPVVNDGPALCITDGRHPVLETIGSDRFIPNDAKLDHDQNQLLIITGPNMAGKSTYMRQVALIVIMAQMGSFVPAAEAEIGVVDRIFTRVGASDNLIEGQSTFMVEMTETANLLHNATEKSLVLLDEIGRGTSTFDGVSIAWAVAEYLHDTVKARTLFATHYHQLTELALTNTGIQNYNIAVREWNDEIIFLRKIVEGGTDRSYGIQVARLAGVPRDVIDRAKEILANLESGELNELGQPRLAKHSGPAAEAAQKGQFTLFTDEPHPVIKALRELDVNSITPIEALKKLDELKKKVEEKRKT